MNNSGIIRIIYLAFFIVAVFVLTWILYSEKLLRLNDYFAVSRGKLDLRLTGFTMDANMSHDGIAEMIRTRNMSFFQSLAAHSCRADTRLVILIMAKFDEEARRNIIRRTWLNWIHMQTRHLHNRFYAARPRSSFIKLFFVFGKSAHTARHNFVKLKYEMLMYNDVVYDEAYVDTYNNLTLKSVFALNWALTHCNHSQFFFKADSDVFITIPQLANLAEEYRKKSMRGDRFIIGNVQKSARVNRQTTAKWFVSHQAYQDSVYPDYTTGPGYLLSRAAARSVVNEALQRLRTGCKLFIWEDVAVTGILAKATHTQLIHSGKIRFNMPNEQLCDQLRVVLQHRQPIATTWAMWKRIVTTHQYETQHALGYHTCPELRPVFSRFKHDWT